MNLLESVLEKSKFLVLGFELDAGSPVNPVLELLNGAGEIKANPITRPNLEFSFDDVAMKDALSRFLAVHYSIIVPSIKKYGLGFGASLDDAINLCNEVGVKHFFEWSDHNIIDTLDDSGESVAILLAHQDVPMNDVQIMIKHLENHCKDFKTKS